MKLLCQMRLLCTLFMFIPFFQYRRPYGPWFSFFSVNKGSHLISILPLMLTISSLKQQHLPLLRLSRQPKTSGPWHWKWLFGKKLPCVMLCIERSLWRRSSNPLSLLSMYVREVGPTWIALCEQISRVFQVLPPPDEYILWKSEK